MVEAYEEFKEAMMESLLFQHSADYDVNYIIDEVFIMEKKGDTQTILEIFYNPNFRSRNEAAAALHLCSVKDSFILFSAISFSTAANHQFLTWSIAPGRLLTSFSMKHSLSPPSCLTCHSLSTTKSVESFRRSLWS